MDRRLLAEPKVKPLHAEAHELTAIFTAAIKTAKLNPGTPKLLPSHILNYIFHLPPLIPPKKFGAC
jgi:hypothetical protein